MQMGAIPSQDQVMGQLRVIIPALGTIVSAVGVSSGDVGKWVNIAMISVGPISYIVVAIWSLIANSRASIMAAAAKPVEPGAPAPQIVLPAQEAALADKLPSNVTASVVKALLIAFALSLFVPHGAFAQARRLAPPAVTGDLKKDLNTDAQNLGLIPPSLIVQPTGNVSADLQTLWNKIVSSSLTDLNYAAAMAASANTTTSTVRLQCLKAIIQLNEQASGTNLKNADGSPMVKPDPHVFTDVESLAEVIDNLSPQGPLFVSCAGAAQLAKTNVLTFVNAVVTGVAGFAAMPVIPGL
jgi:hypothetical protein